MLTRCGIYILLPKALFPVRIPCFLPAHPTKQVRENTKLAFQRVVQIEHKAATSSPVREERLLRGGSHVVKVKLWMLCVTICDLNRIRRELL